MEALGELIARGRTLTDRLWEAPEDQEIRAQAKDLFATLQQTVVAAGTPAMAELCELFCPSANAAPTPQAIEIMQEGLEQLRVLWVASRTSLT
jgi:hypothetical protein